MAIELEPNIFIPKDSETMEGNLRVERQLWLGAKAVYDRSEGFDGKAKRDAAQCMANLDYLLDHYPDGIKRDEAPALLAA